VRAFAVRPFAQHPPAHFQAASSHQEREPPEDSQLLDLELPVGAWSPDHSQTSQRQSTDRERDFALENPATRRSEGTIVCQGRGFPEMSDEKMLASRQANHLIADTGVRSGDPTASRKNN